MSRAFIPPFFLLTLVVPVGAALSPQQNGAVAVLMPPFGRASAVEAVAAAGGQLLRDGRAGVLVARSDAPDFVARLYGAGAMLVLAADEAACGIGTGQGRA